MTRYAAPQRALHNRQTRAVLLCLLLLGGVLTLIYTGTSKIANLSAAGVSFTQPDTPATAGYQLGQVPTTPSNGQQYQIQPVTTTACTGDTYISAYGDTVCTPKTNPTTTVRATIPCISGTRTTEYGDTVCKPIPRPILRAAHSK